MKKILITSIIIAIIPISVFAMYHKEITASGKGKIAEHIVIFSSDKKFIKE